MRSGADHAKTYFSPIRRGKIRTTRRERKKKKKKEESTKSIAPTLFPPRSLLCKLDDI